MLIASIVALAVILLICSAHLNFHTCRVSREANQIDQPYNIPSPMEDVLSPGMDHLRRNRKFLLSCTVQLSAILIIEIIAAFKFSEFHYVFSIPIIVSSFAALWSNHLYRLACKPIPEGARPPIKSD